MYPTYLPGIGGILDWRSSTRCFDQILGVQKPVGVGDLVERIGSKAKQQNLSDSNQVRPKTRPKKRTEMGGPWLFPGEISGWWSITIYICANLWSFWGIFKFLVGSSYFMSPDLWWWFLMVKDQHESIMKLWCFYQYHQATRLQSTEISFQSGTGDMWWFNVEFLDLFFFWCFFLNGFYDGDLPPWNITIW